MGLLDRLHGEARQARPDLPTHTARGALLAGTPQEAIAPVPDVAGAVRALQVRDPAFDQHAFLSRAQRVLSTTSPSRTPT